MQNRDTSDEQLLHEVQTLRQRVADLERAEAERARSEQALRESEQRFRSLVETAPSVILCLTPVGNISEFNPEAERIYGRTREQVLGQSYLDLFVPEEFREGIAADIQKVLRGEPTRGFENPVQKADGAECVISWNVDRLLDERGSPTGIVAIGQDVTDRKKTEQALRFTQFSVDRAADAVFWIEPNAHFRYVNDTACQVLGYSREELTSMTVHDIYPYFPPMAWPSHWQNLKTHGSMTFESHHRTKDGRIFPVEISIRLLEFEGREYNIAFARDITERRRAEEELLLKNIVFESSIAANSTADRNGIIQHVNPAFLEMWGYDKVDETVGNPVSHFFAIQEEATPVLDALNDTGRWHGKFLARRKDGSTFISEGLATVVRNEKGELLGYQSANLDVTDRERAEEALRESEAKLRAVFDHALDGLLLANTHNLQFYAANRAICDMLGYEDDEMLKLSVLDIHPQEALPLVVGQFDRLARREIRVARDIPVRRKDGSVFFADISSGSVTLSDRDYLVGVFRDVTERKQAEEEIRKLNAALERRVEQRTAELRSANQELQAFAYSVSHDLRAPLRGMESFANALLEDYADRLDQDGHEYCRHIIDSASRMDVLINDLLAYSRLGRTELRMHAVSLERAVREAIRQLESDVEERRARVAVEGSFPHVTAHYSTLVQVLANLISNAIKFVAPSVRPAVRIRTESRDRSVRLWVEDNGIGIDDEYQERIFRVFDRLHGVESYPGTGIGLAIVSRAVNRLGGTYGVESSAGTGSRFWVEFRSAEGDDG